MFTFCRCVSVEIIAHLNMLWSSDCCQRAGRYELRTPTCGFISLPTRSIMNDNTYKTCIYKQLKYLFSLKMEEKQF